MCKETKNKAIGIQMGGFQEVNLNYDIIRMGR